MALKKLESLGTYEQINSGAHRKAALIVGVPSLVRHLGLWSISDLAAPAAAEARQDAYRGYVERLRKAIEDPKNAALEPDQVNTVSGLGSKIDTGTVTLVQFWWHKLRAAIRLEFHTEYVTVKSILDLSVEMLGGAGAAEDATFADVRKGLDQFKNLFEACASPTDPRYGEVSNMLQIEIWERFEAEVLDVRAGGRTILGDTLGEIFLDSRGIVTGSTIDPDTEKALPASLSLRQSVRKPFQYPLPRNRARTTIEHRFPGAVWARETLHRLWPFIESEPYFGEYEFTVTGFLQGRVLFITSLGPQVGAPATGKTKWTPIRYFLHAFTDDEWQLGRLVDRINTLGTLRLAATMQIEELKIAAGHMEKLAQEIERALTHVHTAIKEVERDPPTAMLAAEARMQWVGKISQELNDTVCGDISHRLERSRYYVERFGKEASGLRERRIEGYQTYTEFVTRRMSSIFGFISFLRTRFEGIDSLNSKLTRHYSSLKITAVTYGIDQLVESLNEQNDNIVQQGKKLGEQEREIGKIQEFGEFALIGALIPYYVGSTLTDMTSPHGMVKELGWLAIVLGCSSLALYRIGRKRRKALEAKVGKTADEQNVIDETTAHLWWVKRLFIGYMIVTAVACFIAMSLKYNGEWPDGSDQQGGGARESHS